MNCEKLATAPLGLPNRRSSTGRRYPHAVEADLRDWIKGLAALDRDSSLASQPISSASADYLERIATDGTLKDAFAELAEHEPDLAG